MPKKEAKQRNRFKLLAGSHVGPDFTKDPTPVFDPAGNQVGEKYPSKRWRSGEVVEADTDLVEDHGAGKFMLIGPSKQNQHNPMRGNVRSGNPTPGDPSPMQDAAQFPHGQVSTGRQKTSGTPATAPTAQVLGDDEAEELGGKTDAEPEGDGEDSVASDDSGEADFGNMTIPELREYAHSNNINLHGATAKADIVKAIKKGSR